MKTVLFLVHHLSTGGMPQYTFDLIRKIKDDVNIYCIEYSMVSPDFVVQRNKLIELLGNKLKTLPDDKNTLFKIIDDIQPDIIHLQEMPEYFMNNDIADKLYSKDRQYLIVETSHDSSFISSSKRYYPDHFALISEFQRKEFSKLGIPIDLIEADIEYKPRKDRTSGLLELGLDPEVKHVLNVGLWTPRKNQAEILEYAREMERRNEKIQFHFVGNRAGNFQFYWEPLMKDLPSNIKIWDERSDVDNFYSCMDLFLFTSRGTGTDKETSPLVIRESIGHNIPALIYNLPVYLNMYDSYPSISYLEYDFNSNINKILISLELMESVLPIESLQKTAIIIDAYIDSSDREKLLDACIESVIPLGHDIILVSHCPIPPYILKKVNYHIYDKENTFNDNHVYAYTLTDDVEIRTQVHSSHEFPIIQSMRSAISFAKARGYEFFYFTEFDHKYAIEDIHRIKELRSESIKGNKDFIFFKPESAFYGDVYGEYYETSFFGANTNKFLDIFNDYFPNTLDEYNSNFAPRFPNCLEHFFYNAFKLYESDTVLIGEYVKLYFNNSDINLSSYQNIKAMILLESAPESPAQAIPDISRKPYLYLANQNLIPYTFKIYFDDVLKQEFTFQNVFLVGNFRLVPIDPNENTTIRIEIFNDDRLIDSKLIDYKCRNHREYAKNGTILFKKQIINNMQETQSNFNLPFSIQFDEANNKLNFTAKRDLNSSLLVSIKDIDSHACIFSFVTAEKMSVGSTWWAIPLPTNVFSFKNHINFGGILIEYYDAKNPYTMICSDTIRIKDVPIYKPIMDLSNTEPIYNNYDEFFIQKVYDTLDIDGSTVVLDIGANIGLWTEYILTRNAKMVYCVEPNIVALENLKRNMQLHSTNTKIIPKALHTENGTLKFYADKNSLVSSIFPTNGSLEYEVESITFDSLLYENNIQHVDLLKMDIEGAEFNIIESFGKEQFDKIDSFLIEYHEWVGGDHKNIISKLEQFGYHIQRVDGCMFIFAYKQKKSYLIPPSVSEQYSQKNLIFEKVNLKESSGKFTWQDYNLGKHYIFDQMYSEIYNEYSYNDNGCSYERYGCIIESGDIVVDIGANIGMFSNRAYERGAKEIFSFEPSDVAYRCLLHNKPQSCHTFKMALSDRDGIFTLRSPRVFDPMGAGIYKSAETFPITEYVYATTLDKLFAEKLFTKIDFLKIDTEGAEEAILAGLSDENLAKIRKIALEFHLNDLGESAADSIWERMIQNGFRGFKLIYGNGELRIYNFWRE